MKTLLLTVDIGNTSASFGIFDASRKVAAIEPLLLHEIPTGKLNRPPFSDSLRTALKRKSLNPENIQATFVSSVVPAIDHRLKTQLRKITSSSVHFVNARTLSPIRVKYAAPKEVGADRLVNARAAWAYHRGPSIVVDFGTATTFDCISKKAEYLGGVIAPGPVISAQALYERTAKLPFVTLNSPARILGRNTLQSIESGLYHGYRGLVKEILLQLKRRLGKSAYVIATGGQAEWILRGLKEVNEFIPELTLRGLYFLWRDQEFPR